MSRAITILQRSQFERAIKKLHKNQKQDLIKAIELIAQDPGIGEQKKGDLKGVIVYKFKMVSQITLLAYSYDQDALTLRLLDLGSHENFYRDLKR
jgi:mRNA-degrading endonuclease YafQ of YafQ-DinJ toxin-antitoxin module